jgi:magnesium transporter
VIVDCAVYERGRRLPGELPLEEAHDACRRDGAFVWIGLHEPTATEFDAVRREFALHELAVEDAVKAHQRPKLEQYGDSLFVVLKTAHFRQEDETLDLGEIQAFVGESFLITVRHGGTALHDVRLRTEKRPDLLRSGPAAALHAVVDRVVDDYVPVVSALDQAIRDVEAEVFSASRANPAERVYRLKRDVLELQDATVPLQAPLDALAGGEYALLHEDMHPYFRDVHDHLARVTDRLENFSDLLTSVLTANMTQVSVRQNEDVRKISAWAAIFAVPTMITGVYGMNFEHMPELDWRLSYPIVLGVIVVACVALYRYFHRVGWL